ncbi:MAG: hypothetical protein A2V88_11715 [Elusimicrobia bacterium RBG_16_66_12]|nr:MAG: hypothetical protein A2V88_11715 [Elusimicrobia bacterium RBG_16_66_12]
MRPTRLGVSAAGLAAFTLFAAASTGNNLLYLLFSATVSALIVSWAAGRANLRALTCRAEFPDQVFRGAAFPLTVVVENGRRATARLLSVRGPSGSARLDDISGGEFARAELRLSLPLRGRVLVDGLFLESLYPLGFFVLRRRVPPFEVLVLPHASPFSPQSDLEVDPRAMGEGSRRKSREGEFFGPRAYTPEDDARLIHWKLTAKTGRPVVAEHAAAPDGKAVVRLEGTDDASVERAAASCRWYIDAGLETGLAGPGVEVRPARGLEQLGRLLRALALAGAGGSPRQVSAAAAARDGGPADGVSLRRLTLAGGALVYLALFLIEDLSPAFLLALAPLLPLSWIFHERKRFVVPKRLWDALSVVMLLFLLLVDWRRQGVALANAHLLLYLLFNRLLNAWETKDLRQVFLIYYLAFFLVSGLTISPWYFPLFVAWIVFCAAWLTLQSGARAARLSSWAPGAARLLALSAALGTGVFLTVPRVEGLRRFNPFVASGMDKLQARSSAVTGFTDHVLLGHFGTLRRSSARVLRLRPGQPPPAEGSAPDVYVRGGAFDRFDGRGWSAAPLSKTWARRRGAAQFFPAAEDKGGGSFHDMEIYPLQFSVVFTAGPPWMIDGISDAVWLDHTDSVHAAAPFTAGVKYRVYPTESYSDPRGRALGAALETPEDREGREAALVERWTKGIADPTGKAEAVVARLRREYSYSTFSDGRLTSLPDFLFKTRKGNCEYFATAAAVLLRRAGVPTRLVTGFRASEWNEWGRFYDVRQSQAHAWIEAYLPGRGWTLYDATPGETGLSAAADELARRVQRWLDAAQARWYRDVIGYDQYAQRDTLMRMTFLRAFAGLRAALERSLRALLPAAAVLALLIWALRLMPGWLRRDDEYERAERSLSRAGLARRPWQTPREFAREVLSARPELSGLSELVEAHYQARYAGRVPDGARRRQLRGILENLKERL